MGGFWSTGPEAPKSAPTHPASTEWTRQRTVFYRCQGAAMGGGGSGGRGGGAIFGPAVQRPKNQPRLTLRAPSGPARARKTEFLIGVWVLPWAQRGREGEGEGGRGDFWSTGPEGQKSTPTHPASTE